MTRAAASADPGAPPRPSTSARTRIRFRTRAWATAGVAALARRVNGSVAEAWIGLANMGSVPVRAQAAEDAAAGVPGAGRAADRR